MNEHKAGVTGEVSAAMREAGAEVVESLSGVVDSEVLADRVFRAMLAAQFQDAPHERDE